MLLQLLIFSIYFGRLSISFFAISGLDVLGRLDLLDKHRADYINWIYNFQILPMLNNDDDYLERCGFRGSLAATLALGSQLSDQQSSTIRQNGSSSSHPLDTSHIVSIVT